MSNVKQQGKFHGKPSGQVVRFPRKGNRATGRDKPPTKPTPAKAAGPVAEPLVIKAAPPPQPEVSVEPAPKAIEPTAAQQPPAEVAVRSDRITAHAIVVMSDDEEVKPLFGQGEGGAALRAILDEVEETLKSAGKPGTILGMHLPVESYLVHIDFPEPYEDTGRVDVIERRTIKFPEQWWLYPNHPTRTVVFYVAVTCKGQYGVSGIGRDDAVTIANDDCRNEATGVMTYECSVDLPVPVVKAIAVTIDP